MKVSKKKIIEMTLAHPTIKKIVEGIVRTEINSDYRDLMVDAFNEFFVRISTELMKENIGYEFDEDIEVKSRITFSGQIELCKTTGMGTKILTILCKDDNLKFDIGSKDNTWIIMRDFEVFDEEDTLSGVKLSMSVYYTEDEKVNERINHVLKVLGKKG